MDDPKDTEQFDIESLQKLLSGETLRLAQQSSSILLSKYGHVLEEIKQLKSTTSRALLQLRKLNMRVLDQLNPNWATFNLAKQDMDDLKFYRFFNKISNVVLTQLNNSQLELTGIDQYATALLPLFEGKVDFGTLANGESNGLRLISTVQREYEATVLNFDKLLAGIYLNTRQEYKQLRKKFLGQGANAEDKDELEDHLMSSLFGFRPPPKQENLGAATALIDDNCVLTQVLLDLTDSVPTYYKKFVTIKKGKNKDNVKTISHLDNGEIEDFAQLLTNLSHPSYMRFITEPNEFPAIILETLQSFHDAYLPVAESFTALMTKLGSIQNVTQMASPKAIARQYSRINFLAIRPDEEDIAPRTKVEKDFAIARNKVLNHLKDTLESLSGMSRYGTAFEDYALTRVKEVVDLKTVMDDVQQTERKRQLARNIYDDNEFYISKTGQIGALEVEREPAPRIKYEDVIGATFIKAKEHIEEVIKVASHANVMRVSAPRGDIKSNLLLIGPYGCHRKGQKVLMYDGTTKIVENIQVGDLLMGPDSTPRQVKNLVRGVDDMVEIIPNKGDSWVVNKKHTLALVKTQDKEKGYKAIAKHVEVAVSDYLKWSYWKKNIHPLYRVPVEFNNLQELPLDPYFIGIMLGDGCLRNRTSCTTVDQVIIDEIYSQASQFNLNVSIESFEGNRTPSYHLTTGMIGGKPNILRTKFKELDLFDKDSETKFIPHIYKTASRENRLKLLAGLMDTDGSLHGTCSYDYSSKSARLANDVAFVARSVGLAAVVKSCKKKSQNGTEGTYFRVEIFGNTNIIPVRIEYKKAQERKSRKNVLRTGFKTRELLPEEFYGFTVDKDHLYLLNDFTVTRNCGKTEMARAVGADPRIIGFSVSGADILTAYMHESVKNVKRLYEHAKDLRMKSRFTKPVAVLLDEFDRLFTYGEGVHAAYDGKRMEGTLQEMMDGVVGYEGVFMIALTNVPKAVPEAILRRFKFVDIVGQLTREERAILFKQFLTRGLPVAKEVTEQDYLDWADLMDHAPGDVLGKVADEVHFKFMKEFVDNHPTKVTQIERSLAKRLRDKEINANDRAYLSKILSNYKIVNAKDITDALETVIKQPQIKLQINKAKEIYRDAEELMQGLSTIGEKGIGFGANVTKRSKLWTTGNN